MLETPCTKHPQKNEGRSGHAAGWEVAAWLPGTAGVLSTSWRSTEADGRELGPGACHSCDLAANGAPGFALAPRASLWLLPVLLRDAFVPGSPVGSVRPAGQALCPGECVQKGRTAGAPTNGGSVESDQQMSGSRHEGTGGARREAEAAGRPT